MLDLSLKIGVIREEQQQQQRGVLGVFSILQFVQQVRQIWHLVGKKNGHCLHAGCIYKAHKFSSCILRDVWLPAPAVPHGLHTCNQSFEPACAELWCIQTLGYINTDACIIWEYVSNWLGVLWKTCTVAHVHIYRDILSVQKSDLEMIASQCKAVLNWPLVYRKNLVMAFQGR